MTPRVVLLHGIWMPGASMAWHAARLREAGFECEIFRYYGAMQPRERTVQRLVRRLDAGPCHVLAHSLGGLIALTALLREPQLPVQRVVCLGTPLRGSRAAQHLLRRPWLSRALGHAGALLDRGLSPWERPLQVGMIAGSRRIGLGQVFARFDGDHDGTVAVDETWLPGLADHIVLPESHASLLFSREAARQAIAFLHEGHFVHAKPPAEAG